MKRTVIIPGEPKGKGRPRATVIHGHARVYTPATTASYENLVRLCFLEQNADAKPTNKAVSLEVKFKFGLNKSDYNSKGEPNKHGKAKLQGTEFHKKKWDVDNLLKSVMDGLNGVAYTDDCNVIKVTAEKSFSEKPETEVIIDEIE